jgi:hypothetical protein
VVVAVVVLLAAVVGCGPRIDYEVQMDGLGTGYLAGDPHTGCVGTTQTLDVREPTVSPVKWPPGVQARTDPVRLIGPDGAVIAHEGDWVTLGGGSPLAEIPPVPPCTQRPMFIAHEIVSVEPKA